MQDLGNLTKAISQVSPVRRFGTVCGTTGQIINIKGLCDIARVGDLVHLEDRHGHLSHAEILSISSVSIGVLPETGSSGIALGDRAFPLGGGNFFPDESWLGRVVDPFMRPLDGQKLTQGATAFPLLRQAPSAAHRGRLGARIETGIAALDSFLPIVEGQRVGLFAGSGVGKSTLLADLARGMEADVAVIALIGERGRELREFLEDVLGPEGLSRSVVIAATSDQSPMARRRAGWAAMAVAEYFCSQGRHVLFLADSLTRFAEAHREIAAASGEAASLKGYPPSTAQAIMGLCERAGPGPVNMGSITAVFSVLVSGSDMEEPIADIVRGVLDGHIVLDREIAERGRFPAIDILRSVSRSLPQAATSDENQILAKARFLMSIYSDAATMIQAGLYSVGADANIDASVDARPKLEAFLTLKDVGNIKATFSRLEACLQKDPEVEPPV